FKLTVMAAQSNLEIYMGGFAKVLNEQWQVDLRLKAGGSKNGAVISAHKLVLVSNVFPLLSPVHSSFDLSNNFGVMHAARSEVFKKMLEPDNLKASVGKVETVTLSEMKQEELEAFVEFIYSNRSVLSANEKKHVQSLYLAADKYEIPHLRDLCRNELISSLNSSNALNVLELSLIPVDKALIGPAAKFIVRNLKTICNSVEFKLFVGRNPDLSVAIMKASLTRLWNGHHNMEKEAANKMEFFGGLMNAFKEKMQFDIWLKSGDQTDAIPAHKLILAARSKVFRDILEFDDCKGLSMSKETVTLSEMTHDELETFLEFMYNGLLPDTKLAKYVRSLYLAAHKYKIPYLQDLCRNQLITSMNSSNVFDDLELAQIYSDKILEDAVSKFMASHMEEIASSSKFMSFVESNPALTVQTIFKIFKNYIPFNPKIIFRLS
ncbi:unnamed protein product, partial [Thlaspi arvense]